MSKHKTKTYYSSFQARENWNSFRTITTYIFVLALLFFFIFGIYQLANSGLLIQLVPQANDLASVALLKVVILGGLGNIFWEGIKYSHNLFFPRTSEFTDEKLRSTNTAKFERSSSIASTQSRSPEFEIRGKFMDSNESNRPTYNEAKHEAQKALEEYSRMKNQVSKLYETLKQNFLIWTSVFAFFLAVASPALFSALGIGFNIQDTGTATPSNEGFTDNIVEIFKTVLVGFSLIKCLLIYRAMALVRRTVGKTSRSYQRLLFRIYRKPL